MKLKRSLEISEYFVKTFIPLHILSLGMIYFASEFTWKTVLGIALVYGAVGGLGLELGFHRMISHKNFQFKYEFLQRIFIFLGSLAFQGSSLAWVSLHRNHHIHVDSGSDYQSPLHGVWSSYIGWTINPSLYKKINVRLVRELLKDPYQLFLDKHYYKIIWSVALLVLLLSRVLFFTIYLPGILLSFHVSSINNLIGHNLRIGKRPFKVGDMSTDVWWAALFSWGISFQNTHHKFPNELNYGKYSGLDPAYYLFLFLEKSKLVKRLNHE